MQYLQQVKTCLLVKDQGETPFSSPLHFRTEGWENGCWSQHGAESLEAYCFRTFPYPLELVIRVGNSKTDLVGRSATIRLPATGEEGPCPVMDNRIFGFLFPGGWPAPSA